MAGSLPITNEAAQPLDGERAIARERVTAVNGNFGRGEVLHIYDQMGNELALGLSDFTSEESRI